MFRELNSVVDLKKYESDLVSYEVLEEVKVRDKVFPIISLTLGSQDPCAPCFGIFGGVHGLEKIGTDVVTSYLSTIFEEIKWNKILKKTLEEIRIVSIPLVNPGGMFLNQRSNPSGVDIMRNAPGDSAGPSNYFISGHRLSAKLPWYRGQIGVLEKETQVLVDFVEKNMFSSRMAMSIDIHSGFGLRDRLWYPWAKSKDQFPFHKTTESIIHTYEKTLPHNVYKIEQQSDSYLTHGDVWDYLVERKFTKSRNPFIPWTLEIGSWVWLKKNPIQLLDSGGIFNPVKKHRFSRTMRRHKLLLNFLMSATLNYKQWKNE